MKQYALCSASQPHMSPQTAIVGGNSTKDDVMVDRELGSISTISAMTSVLLVMNRIKVHMLSVLTLFLSKSVEEQARFERPGTCPAAYSFYETGALLKSARPEKDVSRHSQDCSGSSPARPRPVPHPH